MKKYCLPVSLALLLSLSTACSNATTANPSAQKEGAGTMAPGFQALQGNWLADCQSGIDHGVLVAGSGSITFSGDQVKATMESYSDANCEKPQFKIEFYGSYSVGSADPRLEPGALPIDFKLVRETYTIYDPAIIQQDESHEACKLGAMKIGVPKDVFSGDICMEQFWIGQAPFRAFKISDGSLRLSSGNRSGESDEYRMIDFTNSFPMRH